jgi:hypothetical protein
VLTVRDNEQDSEHSVGDDEVASSDVAEGGKLVGVCHVQRKSRVNAITCRRDNATRAAGQRGPRVNTGRESMRAASQHGPRVNTGRESTRSHGNAARDARRESTRSRDAFQRPNLDVEKLWSLSLPPFFLPPPSSPPRKHFVVI